jgi:hypothetical protein
MKHAHINFCIALAAGALASFAAQAQTVSVVDHSISAISTIPATQESQVEISQVESGASLAQPLSLTQPYVPARKSDASLQLLIGEPTVATVASVAPAQSDEITGQPAINALGAGRFALTVSQRPAR